MKSEVKGGGSHSEWGRVFSEGGGVMTGGAEHNVQSETGRNPPMSKGEEKRGGG